MCVKEGESDEQATKILQLGRWYLSWDPPLPYRERYHGIQRGDRGGGKDTRRMMKGRGRSGRSNVDAWREKVQQNIKMKLN